MSKENTKSIGLIGAISIGIGGMVGGGIFAVLGEAIKQAHGAAMISFFVGGIVALLTAYSYSKLSVRYPSKGGTVVFIDKAFGVDLFTGTFNFFLWLSYIVKISLYASAFGSYGMTFFPNCYDSVTLKHLLLSLAIILPVIINLVSVSFVSKTETIIVLLKLSILLIVIIASFPYIEEIRLEPGQWSSPLHIVAGGMIIFVAYEGFELIANAAEDIKNEKKTLPLAYFCSVILVIILYVLVAAVTVGTVPLEEIPKTKDYALAVAARPSLGDVGFKLVSISALLATFSAINATLYGNARLGYILATIGECPKILEKEVWDEPVNGVLIVGILALLIGNFFDLTDIAILGSGSFLIIFSLVNAAGFYLSKEIEGNRLIPLAALFATLLALGTLIFQTYETNPLSLWTLVAFLGVSLLFEMIYPRLTRRKLRV